MSTKAEKNAERRNLKFNDLFVGKTVSRVEAAAINVVMFFFTDDTSTTIVVEAVRPSIGLYGIEAAANL